jgi:hypothetical protein
MLAIYDSWGYPSFHSLVPGTTSKSHEWYWVMSSKLVLLEINVFYISISVHVQELQYDVNPMGHTKCP